MDRRKFLGLFGAGALTLVGLGIVNGNRTERLTPSTAPGSDTAPAAPPASGARGDKTLIVFFSRKGTNYPDLDLEVGNTARVAEFIQARINADVYEVEPAVPYPTDYDETDVMARREEQENTFREIKPGAPDTDQYGTVFLGYPIWHGEQPMAVQTFMRDRNLNGARIVPFATHSGSGFGNSLNVLAEYYPQAQVLEGFIRDGEDVYYNPDSARADVNTWLDGLGF